MSLAFKYHCLRRDISNFSLLKHRHFDGFLISMHQGGTHWLKHMLAMALTKKYDLPPPQYIHANDVIAGPKNPRMSEFLPHLVSAHSIPHLLLGNCLFRRTVTLPPYLILVRDIRASLVSNYEKWKEHYQCDFSEYLHGDISGHRFNNDIWWCIRFCNSWGKLIERYPANTRLVRYEDLKSSPLSELQKINQYWKLELSEDDLDYGISESSKEKMTKKKDPETPFGVTVVREDKKHYLEWFSDEEAQFLKKVCVEHLKYNFDYTYK
jgi:hypothetical protein